MEISYKNFTKDHIPDNEAHYFDLLETLIDSMDSNSYFTIIKNPDDYTFRLSLSIRKIDHIISHINSLNNAWGIKADFSKSMRSGNIFWSIKTC